MICIDRVLELVDKMKRFIVVFCCFKDIELFKLRGKKYCLFKCYDGLG